MPNPPDPTILNRPYALSDRQAAVIQRMALKYLGEDLTL